ncbi:MAG: hypothetical protein JWQ28_491 [Pedobacter sp.]|jgi:hypothetical protein|nr:hypothetical protein [Pedobacter sp.]
MIIPDKFLYEEQDPRAVEKVLGKLTDMLSSNEELIYLAVQKRPAVNLLPDCIAVSNKRLFYCQPANFGMTMNFKDLSWKSIKEVSFKEELFGSKFICVPLHGENIVTEYIPKAQARKLYQAAYEQLENFKELQEQQLSDERKSAATEPAFHNAIEIQEAEIVEPIESLATPSPMQQPAIPLQVEEPEDETTLKLRRLKSLYDKQLITQEEYEAKKATILDTF